MKSTISLVFGENLELEESLAMIPPHKWNNELKYTFNDVLFAEKAIISLNYNYHFKKNRISSEKEVTDAYSLINLNFGLDKGNHSFSLHVQNLLNKEYIPHLSLLKERGIFEQGRSISFKYSVTF
mgnify:FL=1|jgi:iron complex outermembrane receptor protein|tara:strand:+ start:183 stop:557 length:375 start_codon:yes stop_codon:yes gene_type:complete